MQLSLLCGPEVHLRINKDIETLKRDCAMSLVMMRNRVGKEEWMMEALIVCMDLFLKSSSLESTKVITSSEGVRCAVRGMSEVKITVTKEQVNTSGDKKETMREPARLPRTQSVGREQSCQPASSWRTRLLQDQENEKNIKKEEEILRSIEKKEERKIARVKSQRRGSKPLRKRLDTLNSESETETISTKSRKSKRKTKVNNTSPPPNKKREVTEGLR